MIENDSKWEQFHPSDDVEVEYENDHDSDLEPFNEDLLETFNLGPDPESGIAQVEVSIDPIFEKVKEAAAALKGILIRMNLSGRINATIKKDTIYLEIKSSEPGLIIGHRGQNLDALQHLVNRIVNNSNNEIVPITVDADDYRDRRFQQLTQMVSSAVDEVSATGKTVLTEPLTPSERRLFHMTAGDIGGVRTISFGSGFFQPIKVFGSPDFFDKLDSSCQDIVHHYHD